MTLRSKILTVAAIAALALGGTAIAGELEVVTNDAGAPNTLDPGCVFEGSFAMRATSLLGEDEEVFVRADSTVGFNNETVLRQEFWFNPRDMVMDNAAKHFINVSRQPTAGQRPMQVQLRFSTANGYSIVGQCVRNCTPGPCSKQSSGVINLPNGSDWQLLRISYAHNTPAVSDGICRIEIIDGTGAGAFASKDNMRNSLFPVGATEIGLRGAPLRPSTVGSHCFDSYQAFRTLASP